MDHDSFIIDLIVQTLVIIGAIIGSYVTIISRIVKLETHSDSFKENIYELWKEINLHRRKDNV